MTRKDIDLTDPHLGSELLKEPQGDLPLDVWQTYCLIYAGYPLGGERVLPQSLSSWCGYRAKPEHAPLKPQIAVEEALPWAFQVVILLNSGKPSEALEQAQRVLHTLVRGSSFAQPKRGQPATMRPIAVRAWVIRRCYPTMRWAQLADLLFLQQGKCPRKIRDEDGTAVCGVSKHQSDSPCVRALQTKVRELMATMENARIPI